MEWVTPPLGIAMVAIASIDITLTLFAPSRRGRLSSAVGHGVWRAVRTPARRVAMLRELAGALAFIAVLLAWVALVIVGFALIYWPFIPKGFLVDFGADLDRSGTANFITALYLSMVSMSTLGFGDIVPAEGWLRLIVPLEAMVGFAVLTGVISWILSIGPALGRRRVLAQRITLMRNAERDVGGGVGHDWDATSLEDALREFARELINAYLRLVAARFLRLDPDLEREVIIQAYVRDFG